VSSYITPLNMTTQGLIMLGLPFPETHGYATLGPLALRGRYPRMDTSPLAIINIRLTSVPSLSDPAPLVHQYLEIYFEQHPEALFYHLQGFEITPEDSNSVESHQTKLDDAVGAIERHVGHHSFQLFWLITSPEPVLNVS
jgi:hypothetical protein